MARPSRRSSAKRRGPIACRHEDRLSTALYPWFKATYEEGGIPGILWEDYQCDGFATETQKREMRIFRERLEAALSSPEASRARAAGVREPNREWRKGTRAMWSYRFDDPTTGG